MRFFRSALVRLTAIAVCLVTLAPPDVPGADPGSGSGTQSSGRASADGEWPQFRGPNRDGVSKETGLLREWPASGPPVLWKAVNAGEGFSSVAISHGRVFTMGSRDGGEYVIAYDVETGKELWATRTGKPFLVDKVNGPRSTPTVEGDRLWALGANGDLWCLNVADGHSVWHLDIFEKFGGNNIQWGLAESPLLDGDHVIVTPGSPSGSIVALDKSTGELVWQSSEVKDRAAYASAIVADVAGVRQIIQFTAAALVGVNASQGKLLWRYERVANDVANCATPILDRNHVFASSAYDRGGVLLSLSADGSGGVRAEELYFTREMMNHYGGMVLLDGSLYGYSNRDLACVDFKTGERKWRARAAGKGVLTAAEGLLYLLSEQGVVSLARPTPDAYEEISRFRIEKPRAQIWAIPVIAGGRLFIRNQDEILCYDIRR